MFKKKPNIPPRPKPPIGEMLIEDLSSGSGEVIFNLTKNSSIKDSSLFCDDVLSPSANSGRESATDPQVVFQQVKEFVEVNQNLKDILVKLQTQNELLQTSNLELRMKAEEIRKQALNALT